MEKRECRVGICDDREEEIRRIEDALKKGLVKAGEPVRLLSRSFLSGEELYEAVGEENYDLLFLDIEMPGTDGFALAKKLCVKRPQIPLVFVSAHESFVFDAPEFSPLWFVRKGNLEEDMYRALKKYFQITFRLDVSYRLKEGFGFRELPVRDILYVECSGHEITICKTDGGRLRKYGSLKAMEEELQGCHFLRIYKNYLVNQEYISEVGIREVYLSDGSTLEMGRDRKNTVRDAMKQYQREKGGR